MAEITTGPQTATTAGPLTGTLDTSALTAHPTLKLEFFGLTPGATARVSIEDTANSSAFSDAQAAAVFDVAGPIGTGDPGDTTGPNLQISITPDLTPSLRFGATNNKLRANLLTITGTSPSVSVHAYTA
jgi:hypothetical protein